MRLRGVSLCGFAVLSMGGPRTSVGHGLGAFPLDRGGKGRCTIGAVAAEGEHRTIDLSAGQCKETQHQGARARGALESANVNRRNSSVALRVRMLTDSTAVVIGEESRRFQAASFQCGTATFASRMPSMRPRSADGSTSSASWRDTAGAPEDAGSSQRLTRAASIASSKTA